MSLTRLLTEMSESREDYEIGHWWNIVDYFMEVLEMIEGKYGKIKVLCPDCDQDGPFIGNIDKDPCDVCGKVKNRVTYELEMKGKRDEKT